MNKYLVTIIRTTVESQVFKVEAEDENDADQAAVALADTAQDGWGFESQDCEIEETIEQE